MAERDFNSEIQALRNDMEREERAMSQCRAECIELAADWLKVWFWKTTEEAVKRDAQVTIALGRERLRELKADVRKLQEQSRELIAEHVDVDGVWFEWRETEKELFYDVRVRDAVLTALRFPMGRLGPILKQFGYGVSSWQEPETPQMSSPPVHYRNIFDVPERLSAKIEQFEAHGKSYLDYQKKLRDVEREKSEQEAAELWEKA